MPITIPAFVQYQSPMFPLRGLWNRAPPEGDQFVNVEIDWLVSPPGSAVQFSLSGNSPVALSQIVALSVDNGRCGAPVDFIFPDSGFVLTVSAHAQGVYPVFTNALMFYASVAPAPGPGAAVGDVTIVQILNSLPPPIPIPPSLPQSHDYGVGISLANGSTQLIPATYSGSINALAVDVTMNGAAPAVGTLQLVDGSNRLVWVSVVADSATADPNQQFHLSGLSFRFINGVAFDVLNSTLSGDAAVNLYWSTP